MQSTARRALLQHVELMSQYQDFGFQRGRGLKQSHSIRTNKRPIANIRQSCSAFSPCCNSAHSILGLGANAARPMRRHGRTHSRRIVPISPSATAQSSSASRQFGGCLMVELTQFKPTERSSIERTSIQDINFRGTNAASPRMTGAPAEEEIDEPTGKFLRPGSDIAYSLEQRFSSVSRALSRQMASIARVMYDQ